ncbi:MAG: helix-hairpin-helix domain-containing protein, partial [Chitinophagaceae bacterium]|nr:helix-hairpin-helix domain-containing protein [Chitinophagaceae bacterium]
MDNFFIAEQLRYLAILMEIHGENPFKAKAYAQAAFQIEKLPVNVNELTEEQIFSIKGVGNSVAKKISELLKTGKISELESYLNNTPPGVIELLQIKGIGPRKIHVIWKEMGIESIGELQ